MSDSPEPAVDRRNMTGLEALRHGLAIGQPGLTIAKLMNYRLTEIEDGHAAFIGTPTKDMCNPMGTVHGGWYGTIMDSCLACAIGTKLPAGAVQTTLEYKVNIIRPIPVGTTVKAIGTAQHVGRSTGIAIGEIRGADDDRLYATGSTTCMVMSLPET